MRQQPRGFTLLEMMIVVVIIAIFSAVMIGMNGNSYGASAGTISDEIASTLNMARTRALATRKIQRVAVRLDLSPPEIQILQSPSLGMSTALFTAAVSANTLQYVMRLQIPRSVTLWSVVAGGQIAGQSPTQTTTEYDIDFRPDGSARGAATIYVTDPQKTKNYRVVVFGATGSTYARQYW
jgi:prepilin-type N-terminal cleavage/methylation domain-containing protein